ncbi:hypothetical protein BSL78_02234 [Apostichopus japonicus]|uniref:Uncharacterized protein n=1 Tax=Stichopus japonicus TaxID=307972 RepID=A0A2G8LKR4_STIJA|nr:hypothetical protein BSL78_02234 [Apostichopus japonicus]
MANFAILTILMVINSTYYGLITSNSRMEHGPSVEDLIHSIHQDPVSTNQYPQNGLWNVPAVTNSDFQSGNQMLHQDVAKCPDVPHIIFQTDRPQTPYFTPHSSQWLTLTGSNTTEPSTTSVQLHNVHEEVTFTPPLSTTSQQNGGILYNPGVRSAESAVTSQPSSPRTASSHLNLRWNQESQRLEVVFVEPLNFF